MRILSGIQPSSHLHLGNYLGAIKQWIALQNHHECVFFAADLHAITVPYQPRELQDRIKNLAIAYLAAGVDPDKSILFVQSEIKEHSELFWLLNTVCPVGDLQRMTQYKDKAKKVKEVSAGLLNYPILQAADILLYKTEVVPVGKDQEQHIEFTRMLAKKFNQRFGETFKEPEAMILKEGAKIMSLTDPKKKMSKSDDPKSCIFLFDEPAAIQKKIISATTDSGKDVKYNLAKKPGISNLLTIYSLLTGQAIRDLEKQFEKKSYAEFKKSLAETVAGYLEPFRKKHQELTNREVYVQEILRQGTRRARTIAQVTMQEVRAKMGLAS